MIIYRNKAKEHESSDIVFYIHLGNYTIVEEALEHYEKHYGNDAFVRRVRDRLSQGLESDVGE